MKIKKKFNLRIKINKKIGKIDKKKELSWKILTKIYLLKDGEYDFYLP